MFDFLLFKLFAAIPKLIWQILQFTGLWIFIVMLAVITILKETYPAIYAKINNNYSGYALLVINGLLILYITATNIVRCITHDQSFNFIKSFRARRGKKFISRYL